MRNVRKLNRRDFLKAAGTATLAGIAVSCTPAQAPTTAPVAPTSAPAEPTQASAANAAPTATQAAAAPAKTDEQGPYGKYAQTIVMKTVRSFDTAEKLPEGDSPENNQYTRYVKDQLNIDVQYLWTAAATDYDQKVNLSIASNDLPDAMIVNLAQFTEMVKADQLADLTQTYNEFASPKVRQMMDSSKGVALKAVTKNGKIMAIPSLTVPDDDYQLMWIRKDWLDKLGLDVPKTMGDVEKVAQAFVEKDPGGNGAGNTIGIVGPQNGGNMYATFLAPTNIDFGFDPVFFSYHAYPGFWIKGPDGKAAYGSIQPEAKTALARLADLYKKGLIDKEMGVRKDASETVISGKAGIWFGEWWAGYWPLPDSIKNNPKANWQAYAVPLDSSGMWNPHGGTPATTFAVVRKGYEHPEAAMKIVNLFNRDESKFDQTKGQVGNEVLRLPQAMYDEGETTYKALMDVLAGKAKPEDYADPKYDVYKLLKDDVTKVRKVKKDPIDKMDIEFWDAAADMSAWNRMYSILVGDGAIYNPIGGKDKVNRVFSLTYAPTPTVTSKWVNLKKLEDETFLKIILGNAPIDAFDQFVKDWKAQGGDAVTAEIQAAVQ